jgi:type I restriction enzyme M protein
MCKSATSVFEDELDRFASVITSERAVRNNDNLAPSGYVATNEQEGVLPLEAVVLLSEAEEERAMADHALEEVLQLLHLK